MDSRPEYRTERNNLSPSGLSGFKSSSLCIIPEEMYPGKNKNKANMCKARGKIYRTKDRQSESSDCSFKSANLPEGCQGDTKGDSTSRYIKTKRKTDLRKLQEDEEIKPPAVVSPLPVTNNDSRFVSQGGARLVAAQANSSHTAGRSLQTDPNAKVDPNNSYSSNHNYLIKRGPVVIKHDETGYKSVSAESKNVVLITDDSAAHPSDGNVLERGDVITKRNINNRLVTAESNNHYKNTLKKSSSAKTAGIVSDKVADDISANQKSFDTPSVEFITSGKKAANKASAADVITASKAADSGSTKSTNGVKFANKSVNKSKKSSRILTENKVGKNITALVSAGKTKRVPESMSKSSPEEASEAIPRPNTGTSAPDRPGNVAVKVDPSDPLKAVTIITAPNSTDSSLKSPPGVVENTTVMSQTGEKRKAFPDAVKQKPDKFVKELTRNSYGSLNDSSPASGPTSHGDSYKVHCIYSLVPACFMFCNEHSLTSRNANKETPEYQ